MKKFFLLFAAALFAFAACEPTTNPDGPQGGNDQERGTLTVTEKSVEIAFYGGEGTINYTLTDVEEGAKPSVVANQEWISNISVNEAITFDVELNGTSEQRVAIITVSYGEEQSFQVFVNQAAGYEVDVEFTATAINGEYYGTKYSADPNYFVVLSEKGTTGFSDIYLDKYYRLDIYSKTPAGDVLTLPEGVYTFDYLDQGYGNTFGIGYSYYLNPSQDGNYRETIFDDGVIIVTENRVEAILVLKDNGEVHHVVYEGSLELSWLEFPEPEYYSTLTEDYSFAHNNGTIRFFHYGDYYGIGASNWTITVMLSGDPLNGDYIMVDLNTDSVSTQTNSDDVIGTYTCVASEAEVAHNTFTAGSMDGNSYEFSWLQYIVDNYVDHSRRAPLAGGTITIAAEGTGYIVTFDCQDDNGHKVTGTFNCPTVKVYDDRQ
ncbi:MAG: BACON domain-containing protein [Alistipes sp.]|nr:BACON domain-containing protein [Alistipes sp.]